MKSDALSSNNIIGNTLAELRKGTGLTQKQFAKIFNISESTLAHYEQGITPPSAFMLTKFADYFHVPVDYILGRCQNKTEYQFLNNKLSSDMTLGSMVDIIAHLQKSEKKYLYDTIVMILKARKGGKYNN